MVNENMDRIGLNLQAEYEKYYGSDSSFNDQRKVIATLREVAIAERVVAYRDSQAAQDNGYLGKLVSKIKYGLSRN